MPTPTQARAATRGIRPPRVAVAVVVFTAVCAALAGCEFEDRPRTLVEEVRIVGARVSPPEVGFSERVVSNPVTLTRAVELNLQALIVDPGHEGQTFEVAAVACTEIDGECLESLQYKLLGDPWVDEDGELTEVAWRDYLTTHAARGRVNLTGPSGEASLDLNTFEGWPWYLQELGLSEYDPRLTLLSCLPGACPAFDALDAYLADEGATGGGDVLSRLVMADAATQGLAMDTYALGKKAYKVSKRDAIDLNHNPNVEAIFAGSGSSLDAEPVALASSQTVVVRITPESFEEIYGDSGLLGIEALTVSLVTSSGSVAPNIIQVSYTIGEIQAVWQVPEAGDAYLWATVRDSRGGMGWAELHGVR